MRNEGVKKVVAKLRCKVRVKFQSKIAGNETTVTSGS